MVTIPNPLTPLELPVIVLEMSVKPPWVLMLTLEFPEIVLKEIVAV
jgi:hypothetical protein